MRWIASGTARFTWRTHAAHWRRSETTTSTWAWRRPRATASGSSGCPPQEKTVRAHPVRLRASTNGRTGGSRRSLSGSDAGMPVPGAPVGSHGTNPPPTGAGPVPCEAMPDCRASAGVWSTMQPGKCVILYESGTWQHRWRVCEGRSGGIIERRSQWAGCLSGGTGDTRGGFADRAVLLYRAMVARWDYMARFRYVPDGWVRSFHRPE